MTEAPRKPGEVRLEGLRRTFRTGRRGRGPEVTALDGVDLNVPAGEVHGLLGPNGAGKTTLCRILSTVLLPTSGKAWVAGHDVVRETAAARRSLGIVFGGDRGFHGRLTARQTVRFWAVMYQVPRAEVDGRVDAALERVGLGGHADGRVETFSRGMKQRLHLARGIVGDPAVLILDEPTTGMDPVAAREFRRLVQSLPAEGRTVVLTTHDMAEAEAMCHRVTLVDGGRFLATERPDVLGRWLSRYERVDVRGAPADLLARVSTLSGVSSVTTDDQTGWTRIETAAEGAGAQVLGELAAAGMSTVRSAPPSLEEVYLHVLGDRGLVVR